MTDLNYVTLEMKSIAVDNYWLLNTEHHWHPSNPVVLKHFTSEPPW
jgi:hypothetical protein